MVRSTHGWKRRSCVWWRECGTCCRRRTSFAVPSRYDPCEADCDVTFLICSRSVRGQKLGNQIGKTETRLLEKMTGIQRLIVRFCKSGCFSAQFHHIHARSKRVRSSIENHGEFAVASRGSSAGACLSTWRCVLGVCGGAWWPRNWYRVPR